MDEKIRREEMSDIDAMNAMEEIDRISTGEGADELNGVWSSAGPRGISDGVMDNMEQIPPDEFEQGQPAEPMHERRGGGGGIWRAVGQRPCGEMGKGPLPKAISRAAKTCIAARLRSCATT